MDKVTPGFNSTATVDPGIPQEAPGIPANDTDFSMFLGNVPPPSGHYIATTPTRQWVWKTGWTKWRHSDLKLST